MLNCQPCRTAGDLNYNLVNPHPEKNLSDKERKAIENRIKQLHEQCEDRNSCTCQHRVGAFVARG